MNTDHTLNENDVLCGRGGGSNNHKGNITFRQIVASRQSSYLNAQKAEKKVLAESIVHQMREKGGRFLKYNDRGELEDIGDIKAIQKTCQALREGIAIRTHRRDKNERNDQITSTFYRPQNHNVYYQRSEVHSAHYGVNPPNFLTQAHSLRAVRQNDNRVAQQQQHFNHARQQQRPMCEYFYGESQQCTGSCNYSNSNCLKFHCRCLSNSNICQPSSSRCKDYHGTPRCMQELNEAPTKISKKSTSPFYRCAPDPSNCTTRPADNQCLLGNQLGPSQTNVRFSRADDCGHGHEMPTQHTAHAAMNSHDAPLS